MCLIIVLMLQYIMISKQVIPWQINTFQQDHSFMKSCGLNDRTAEGIGFAIPKASKYPTSPIHSTSRLSLPSVSTSLHRLGLLDSDTVQCVLGHIDLHFFVLKSYDRV